VLSLSIVTPCCRPNNLHHLEVTIPGDCEWIIVVDGTSSDVMPAEIRELPNVKIHHVEGGVGGSTQRNLALRHARGQYVYFLDDDNIIHPHFFQEVMPLLDGRRVIVVNQIWADGERHVVAAPPVRVGSVDTGQVILPLDLAREFEWKTNVKSADGDYFGRIWEKYSDRFVFVHKDLAYYNYLSPRPVRSPGAPGVSPVTDPILRPVAWTLKHIPDRIAVQELEYIGQIVQAELLRRSEAGARA
jgi:glycosyltransferase involved in cell wall biosynthesis